jgi:hypothetical protein
MPYKVGGSARAALLLRTAFLAHGTIDASCVRSGAERTPTMDTSMFRM